MDDRNNYVTCRRCGNRRRIDGQEMNEHMKTFTEKFPRIKILEKIELELSFCADCKTSDDPDAPAIHVFRRQETPAEA